MKVLIGVNTLSVLDQSVYSNHAQFYFRLGRSHPDIEFGLCHPRRMSIDRMRNFAAKAAVENGFDYLMFVDDDVIIPPNAFAKLLEAKKDIIAGWTIIRGYPFHNMFFKWDDDEKRVSLKPYDEFEEPADGLLKVAAVGFSCVLINCELFKQVPPPWFVTGAKNTEDIYFCMKALQKVPDISVYVHTQVRTAHLLGQDAVEPNNVNALRDYYKVAYPSSAQPENPPADRGDEYLEMVKKVS